MLTLFTPLEEFCCALDNGQNNGHQCTMALGTRHVKMWQFSSSTATEPHWETLMMESLSKACFLKNLQNRSKWHPKQFFARQWAGILVKANTILFKSTQHHTCSKCSHFCSKSIAVSISNAIGSMIARPSDRRSMQLHSVGGWPIASCQACTFFDHNIQFDQAANSKVHQIVRNNNG